MESSMKSAATLVSTDAVASFVEQMGMLLFGADADVMDRSVRTEQANEALSRFINDSEISTLEVYLTGTEGKFLLFESLTLCLFYSTFLSQLLSPLNGMVL